MKNSTFRNLSILVLLVGTLYGPKDEVMNNSWLPQPVVKMVGN